MLARDLKKRECYSDLQRLIYLTNAAHVICFYDLCNRFEYTEYLYPFAYSALLWMIRVRERIVELTP